MKTKNKKIIKQKPKIKLVRSIERVHKEIPEEEEDLMFNELMPPVNTLMNK